jgi:hypothetical protein
MEEMQAEMDALLAENAALKAPKKTGGGRVTIKSSCFVGSEDKNGKPGKGTVGVYGTGQYPISAYANQWMKVVRNAADMGQYILANADVLGFKEGQKEIVVKFFEEAAEHLAAIAKLD